MRPASLGGTYVTRDDVMRLAGQSGIYLVPLRGATQCAVGGDTGLIAIECCPCAQADRCPIVAEAHARGPVSLEEYGATLDDEPGPEPIFSPLAQ